MGIDLIRPENGSDEALFKAFWHHTDAIVCCALKVVFWCPLCRHVRLADEDLTLQTFTSVDFKFCVFVEPP